MLKNLFILLQDSYHFFFKKGHWKRNHVFELPSKIKNRSLQPFPYPNLVVKKKTSHQQLLGPTSYQATPDGLLNLLAARIAQIRQGVLAGNFFGTVAIQMRDSKKITTGEKRYPYISTFQLCSILFWGGEDPIESYIKYGRNLKTWSLSTICGYDHTKYSFFAGRWFGSHWGSTMGQFTADFGTISSLAYSSLYQKKVLWVWHFHGVEMKLGSLVWESQVKTSRAKDSQKWKIL